MARRLQTIREFVNHIGSATGSEMIELMVQYDCASVSSLVYAPRAGFLVNCCPISEGSQCPEAKLGRINLAVKTNSNSILSALPGDDHVEVRLSEGDQEMRVCSTDAYSFSWLGGFIGNERVFLVKSEGIDVIPIKASGTRALWVSTSGVTLAVSRGSHLLAMGEAAATLWKIGALESQSIELLQSITADDGVSAVALGEDIVIVVGYNGEITRLNYTGSRSSVGNAEGLRGSCLAALVLPSGFVRTIWSSGWLVDFDFQAHECMRVHLGIDHVFRAAFDSVGRTAAVWDGERLSILRILVE